MKQKRPIANIIKSEFSGSQALSDRTKLPIEAIQKHKNEIKSMLEAIENARSNRQAFQKLPKHMRRRAASHNPKRVPKFLRAAATAQIVTKPPSRRRKRGNRRNIVANYANREGKVWLATHIWHAKRMRMIDIWGYRLALTSNHKGKRPNYRALSDSAMIFDLSYTECFEIKGRDCLAFLTSSKFDDDKIESQISLDFEEYIAPAHVMFHPLDPETFWLWLHPSATPQFEDTMNRCISSNVSFKKLSDLSRLSLIGEKSLGYVSELLSVENVKKLEACLENEVISFETEDPRLGGKPKNSECITVSKLWNESDRSVIEPPRDHDLNCRKNALNLMEPVLPADSNTTISLIVIKQASNNMKNRMDLIVSKKQSFSIWKRLIEAGAKAGGLMELNDLHFEMGLPAFPRDFPDCTAFKSWAIDIVGHELQTKHERRPPAKRCDYSDILALNLNPFYPDLDSLLAPGGKAWVLRGSWVQTWIEDILKLECPSETLAQEKLSSVYNQRKDIRNAFLLVKLKACAKGNLEPNSILYSCLETDPIDLPEPDDVSLLPDLASIDRNGQCDYNNSENENENENDNYDEMSDDQSLQTDTLSSLSKTNFTRPWLSIPKDKTGNTDTKRIIGLTTSGGYSLTHGKSFAIGFIRVSGLLFDGNINFSHLWFRSPKWKDHLRLAEFEIMN